MSDAQGLTTDTAPPGGLVGDGVVSTPPGDPAGAAPASAPAGTPDVLAEPPTDQAVFPRSYVESIRREAQTYRGRAQEYDDVFGRYEPQDRDVWFNLARTWESDPSRAAQIMQQIANGVLGETEQKDDKVAEPEVVREYGDQDDPNELTPERVQQMMEEAFQTREQRAAEQKAIDDVMGEVRAAGYDPNTAEGFMVLWNANNQTNGDIKAAAEMVQTYRQTIVDEYVQGRSSGRVAMPSASGGVQATPNGEPIRNFDDARRAADRFLQERRGA